MVEPVFLGIAPRSKETLTPAEAFARPAGPTPTEVYRQLTIGAVRSA